MGTVVDRVGKRAEVTLQGSKTEPYISLYDILDKITSHVVQENQDLVNDITLGKVPESALEMAILKDINRYNYRVFGKDRDVLVKEVKDHIFRYGLIQDLLDTKDCSGVFINGPNNVWAKIGSKMVRTDINFGSVQNITSFIYNIKATLRGEINENIPLAKFEDKKNKLRIICCLQVMSHTSPTVVIRKHGEEGFTLSDLVQMGMLSKELAEDLSRYNRAGTNIIVCGKGGAGKTTLMRALLDDLQEEIRILAIEEQAELFLKHPNAIQMIVKRSENGKIVNMLDIAEKGLLMTIDRYVFGEIRSGEAMSFFYGAFSGNVSMTSLHAGSARQALRKAMIMMKMSGTDLGNDILMDMLAESTNIIIFLDSFVVTEVVEVVKESEGIEYNTLWRFNINTRHATFIEGDFECVGQIKSRDTINKLQHSGQKRKDGLACYI